MTKIEKQDIDNIKLVVKETKLKNVSKIRIKKNNYEIEITSENFLSSKPSSQILERLPENKDSIETKEIVNEENIVKSPMVGVAYLSADPNSSPYVKIGQHVKAGETCY